jgi:hypothetical protein
MTTAGARPQQPPDPDLSALRAGAIRVAAETCHLTRRWQADPAAAGAGLGEAAACTARALAGIAGPLAGMIASHDPRRAGQLGGLAAALADAAGRYTGQGQHDITACAALFGLLGPATILTGRALQSARARGTATPRPDLAVNGARCAPGAPRPDDGAGRSPSPAAGSPRSSPSAATGSPSASARRPGRRSPATGRTPGPARRAACPWPSPPRPKAPSPGSAGATWSPAPDKPPGRQPGMPVQLSGTFTPRGTW